MHRSTAGGMTALGGANGRRRCAVGPLTLVVALVLGACASQPPASSAPASMGARESKPPKQTQATPGEVAPLPDEDRATLRARLQPDRSGKWELDVQLRMPLAFVTQPYRALRVRFRDEAFRKGPSGYARFVDLLPETSAPRSGGTTLRTAAAGSAPRPWQEELEPPQSKVLELHYRVRLEHHLADPVVGLDEVPHPTKGGYFLNGRAFVPTVHIVTADGSEKELDMDAALSLRVPAGQRLVASVGTGSGPWATPSLGELRNALYYSGKFQSTRVQRDAVETEIVSADFDARALAGLSTLVARTLELGTRHLGPLSPQRLLIVYDQDAERGGGVVGKGISLMYSEPPDGSAGSPMGIVVVHELMHLWNRGDVWWLNEGLTRYFELVMSLRLDGVASGEASARLIELNDRYRSAAPKASVDKAEGTEAYAAGALYAFCLDAELRRQGSDFFRLHRRMRELAGNGKALTATNFDAAVQQIAPALLPKARAQRAAKGPVELEPCLSRAGFSVKKSSQRRLTAAALATRVFGITGHDLNMAVVMRVPDGSPFHPGDRVLSVNGRSVRNFDEIGRVVSALSPGAPIAVAVQGSDGTREVPLRMPRLSPEAWTQHPVVAVTRLPQQNPLIE
ncbi:MAG: hypothetical protein R3B13_40430 [Polyangiaceae bacterium]